MQHFILFYFFFVKMHNNNLRWSSRLPPFIILVCDLWKQQIKLQKFNVTGATLDCDK
jgi:hypothetical protein